MATNPHQITRHFNQPNWYLLIKNKFSHAKPLEAFQLYKQHRCSKLCVLGVVPLLLKYCASLALLECGKTLHAESTKLGFVSDVVVGTSLVSMYWKCDNIIDARKLFDEMPVKNTVTYNAMIGGYMRIGDTKSASLLFDLMSMRSNVTWIEMINGFARNGDVESAKRLFDTVPLEQRNVVMWTVMVDGFCSNGMMEAAKEVFDAMPERNFYAWSSMISGYCKRGDVKEAEAIFCSMPVKNLVNWNSMISGYAQNGLCNEALKAFGKMQREGIEPDEVTMVSVLSACTQSELLDVGKKLHNLIEIKGMKGNHFILNALVDMYAKCGNLENARLIFEGMTSRNSACWNAMISGFTINGQCKEALDSFAQMEDSSENPDDITFLSVLSACAHGGFVDEGLEIFCKMKKYSVVAEVKHYGCLVDVLARGGRLKEAYHVIERMPMEPNPAVWGALLGACRIHANLEMAEHVVKEIVVNELIAPSNDNAHFVLLSNIYAASDKWENAERMRLAMEEKGFQKERGCSSVVVVGKDEQLRVQIEA